MTKTLNKHYVILKKKIINNFLSLIKKVKIKITNNNHKN